MRKGGQLVLQKKGDCLSQLGNSNVAILAPPHDAFSPLLDKIPQPPLGRLMEGPSSCRRHLPVRRNRRPKGLSSSPGGNFDEHLPSVALGNGWGSGLSWGRVGKRCGGGGRS